MTNAGLEVNFAQILSFSCRFWVTFVNVLNIPPPPPPPPPFYSNPPLFMILEPYQPRPPMNPKIQTLLNEIIDDGIAHSQPLPLGNFEKTHVSALKNIKLASFEDDKTPPPPPPPPLLRETMVKIEKPLSPPPSSSVIANIFPPIAPPAAPNPSRTRESLVDYSDDDDDESNDESIDILDLPTPDNVKFLPTTIEGLRASFEELIKNITEDRKSGGHENTGNRN